MHYSTLMMTIMPHWGAPPYVQQLKERTWVNSYIFFIRKTLLNPASNNTHQCYQHLCWWIHELSWGGWVHQVWHPGCSDGWWIFSPAMTPSGTVYIVMSSFIYPIDSLGEELVLNPLAIGGDRLCQQCESLEILCNLPAINGHGVTLLITIWIGFVTSLEPLT